MFKGHESETENEASVTLPQMSILEHVVNDYAATSFSIKAHPLSFIKEQLTMLKTISTQELSSRKDGDI